MPYKMVCAHFPRLGSAYSPVGKGQNFFQSCLGAVFQPVRCGQNFFATSATTQERFAPRCDAKFLLRATVRRGRKPLYLLSLFFRWAGHAHGRGHQCLCRECHRISHFCVAVRCGKRKFASRQILCGTLNESLFGRPKKCI